jgi:peptide-methionine (S)-S-oxide reductase
VLGRRLLLAWVLVGLAACERGVKAERAEESGVSEKAKSGGAAEGDEATGKPAEPAGTKLATFGGGCYWCVEAVFERVEGVLGAESGFSGGLAPNPTYEDVCGGDTGHAEVVQVRYDPRKVRYEQLLEIFWKTHDPTTPNRQGADVGTQYRSVVFFHDEEQKKVAESVKADLEAAKAFDRPIVTQIAPFEGFWPAPEKHQGFYDANRDHGYCRAVIAPKIEKLEKVFRDRLKK